MRFALAGAPRRFCASAELGIDRSCLDEQLDLVNLEFESRGIFPAVQLKLLSVLQESQNRIRSLD